MLQSKRISINNKETPYLIYSDGRVWSEKRQRFLNGTTERNEYTTFYITVDGFQYNLLAHRLVAEAFLPNPNNYTVVHHKDGNKHNNDLSNLEWVAQEENAQKHKPIINKNTNNHINYDDFAWYEMSNHPGYYACHEGYIYNSFSDRVMYGSHRNGYLRVQIEQNYYSIHRLIYETFVGKIEKGKEIDHIDRNRYNNNINNLRVVTRSENMINASKNGHAGKRGVIAFNREKEIVAEYDTIQAAADAMNVSHPAIRSAIERKGKCKGLYWKIKEE